jgi:hypothetical protein
MPLSAARCVKAQLLSIVVLAALSREVGAQPDTRDPVQELRERAEALEKKLEEPPAPPPRTAETPPPQAVEAPPPPPPAAPPPPPAAAPQPSAETPKPQASKPDAPKPEARKPEAPTPSESEEAGAADEGARALERALIREGGLVLPRGVIEVEPRFQYTYRGNQGLNLVTVAGVPQVAQQDLRRNDVEASVAVRVGLPASFQAEARLPYVWAEQNRATSGAGTESEQVSGWGDAELGLSKQLATTRRGGLLGSLLWKSVSGEHELGRLSPGSGFPSLQAALTAMTREDPLVFFVTPSYTWVFERERSGVDVNPGDAIGLKAGMLLAASPETSLRASFELSHSARTRIAERDVAGSDTTLGILELGLAKVLTRRTLLDVEFGIGLTSDTPDFRLRIALPIRFGP